MRTIWQLLASTVVVLLMTSWGHADKSCSDVDMGTLTRDILKNSRDAAAVSELLNCYKKGDKNITKVTYSAVKLRKRDLVKLLLTYCPSRAEADYDDCYNRTSTKFYKCSLMDKAEEKPNKDIKKMIEEYMEKGCGICLEGSRTADGYKWNLPEIKAGNTTPVNCPSMEGVKNATWKCLQDSTWDVGPDLSNCHIPETTSSTSLVTTSSTRVVTGVTVSASSTIFETDASPTKASSIMYETDASPTKASSIVYETDASPTKASSIVYETDASPMSASSIVYETDASPSASSSVSVTEEIPTSTTANPIPEELSSLVHLKKELLEDIQKEDEDGSRTSRSETTQKELYWLLEEKRRLEEKDSPPGSSSISKEALDEQMLNITSEAVLVVAAQVTTASQPAPSGIRPACFLRSCDNQPSRDTFVHCMVKRKENNADYDFQRACKSCKSLGHFPDNARNSLFRLTQKTLSQNCGMCLTGKRSIHGYEFTLEATPKGNFFSFSCPRKTKHSSGTWQCGEDASWKDLPDLSACRGSDVLGIVRNHPDKKSSPEEVLSSVAEAISIEELFPGDVLDVIEILSNMSSEMQPKTDVEDHSEALRETESVFKTVMAIRSKVLLVRKNWTETTDQAPAELQHAARIAALAYAKELAKSNADGHVLLLGTGDTVINSAGLGDVNSGLPPNASFSECIGQMVNNSENSEELEKSCIICGSKEIYDDADDEGNGTRTLLKRTLSQLCGICLAEIRYIRDYEFHLETTSAGKVFSFSCPLAQDSSSKGTWRCKEDSTWAEHPDLSKCRSNFSRMSFGNDSMTALERLVVLNQATTNSTLMPGDVLNVFEKLSEFQAQQDDETKNNTTPLNQTLYLNTVFDVIDDLLTKPNTFKDISSDTKRTIINEVQVAMDKTYETVSRSLSPNGTIKSNENHIAMTVMKRPPEFFNQRENRMLHHEYFKKTSVLLPRNFYLNYKKEKGENLSRENGERPSIENREDPSRGDVKNSSNSSSPTSPGGSEAFDIMIGLFSFENLHYKLNDIPWNITDIGNEVMSRQVNSPIIGVSLGFERWKAANGEYIEVNLSHVYNGFDYGLKSPECAWWDIDNKSWSSDGCSLYYSTESYTICHCNHLTNLALIMDIQGYYSSMVSEKRHDILEWITIIGCSLSIFFLLLTIISLLLVKREKEKAQRSNPHRTGLKGYIISMNICLSLGLFLFLLLVGLKRTEIKIGCSIIAGFLHYLILSTFTWHSINAFILYQKTSKVFSGNYISAKTFLLTGYCFPLLFIGGALSITKGQAYNTEGVCWLARGLSMYMFLGTMVIFLMANLAIYGLIIKISSANVKKKRFIGLFSLFLLLGLTWITGFLVMISDTFVLHVMFVVLNALQGCGVFFFEVVLNDSHRKIMMSVIRSVFQQLCPYECHVRRRTSSTKILKKTSTDVLGSESLELDHRGESNEEFSTYIED